MLTTSKGFRVLITVVIEIESAVQMGADLGFVLEIDHSANGVKLAQSLGQMSTNAICHSENRI